MSEATPPPVAPVPPVPPTDATVGAVAEAPKRNWFARHKVLTTIGALIVVSFAIKGATGGTADDTTAADAKASTPAVTESAIAEATDPAETQVAEPAPAEDVAEITGGDYIVGDDIDAGQYRAFVDTDALISLCSVSQTTDAGDVLDIRIANEGAVIFTVADKPGSTVSFSGCAKVESTKDVPGTVPAAYTNGDYRVGAEIAPGKYRGTVDTDAIVALGSITQTKANGDVMDIQVGDEGKVVFTVKKGDGTVVSFSGLKNIEKVS